LKSKGYYKMKLKKLVIALGLAGTVLTGCDGSGLSSSDADFNVTAIDGYIVDGIVTVHCGYEYQNTYTARTNKSGVASLVTYGAPLSQCYAEISGDENTYDADAPDTSWKHSMKSLPGRAVINPFTDIAVTLSEVAGNELLNEEELKNKVLELLGYDDNHASSAILFEDFGENAGESEDNAEVAFLAQAVFDTKTQMVEQLGEENNTPANLAVVYKVILPQAEKAVASQIQAIKDKGEKVSDSVITITISVPQIAIDNGNVDEAALNNEHVDIQVEVKPKPTDPAPATGATGTGTGTSGVNQG
jgi:hypothetical protein